MNIRELEKQRRSKKFFLRNAEYVAKNILGDYLVLRRFKTTLVGKIVETESYLGLQDDASHSFGGKITPRNRIMYREGGFIYIYLIYGKFWCFNIVVSKKDNPQAVFIRAIEPIAGIETMKRKRGLYRIEKLTNGPCRWTTAFGMNRDFLGESITSRNVFISQGNSKAFTVVRTKRIGIEYATQSKDLPLRFYIQDNPFISQK
ncbi:MAG: DNA-3-methyladenine glycosylase [Candidatus Omnitrophota bacterium]|nr:MAG: DNA-3-methyladenine glycosylase [Candidatus Omnitrophota bacterium]